MPFISWPSFFLILAVTAAYIFASARLRVVTLSLGNLIIAFALLGRSALTLIAVTLITFAAIRLFRERYGRAIYLFTLALALAPLIVLRSEFDFSGKSIWISISLAFYSLQIIGALIDIYQRRASPPRDLPHWIAFTLFFPTLTAGPITRWTEMAPQILSPQRFRFAEGINAIGMFMQGLFKKMVFAAPFYILIDRFFVAPTTFDPLVAVAVAFMFRYAIWADLSAHADWAQGSARLLGLTIPPNFTTPFHVPFQSARISDFWRRWHSSLSNWLQDYVFLPLSFGPFRRHFSPSISVALALMCAFAVLGLWHGIALGFLLMGLVKGLGVLISEFTLNRIPWNSKLSRTAGRAWGSLLLVIFVVMPTLLLRMSPEDFGSLFSPDKIRRSIETFEQFKNSWSILVEDKVSPSAVPLSLTIGVALMFELLQYLRSRKSSLISWRPEIDFLTAPYRFIAVLCFIAIFFLIARFETWMGFAYVLH